jgi:hypothetical protein
MTQLLTLEQIPNSTKKYGFVVDTREFSRAFNFAKAVAGGRAITIGISGGQLHIQARNEMTCQTSIGLLKTQDFEYRDIMFTVLGNLHAPALAAAAGAAYAFQFEDDGEEIVSGILRGTTGSMNVRWPYTLASDVDLRPWTITDDAPIALEAFTNALRLVSPFAGKKDSKPGLSSVALNLGQMKACNGYTHRKVALNGCDLISFTIAQSLTEPLVSALKAFSETTTVFGTCNGQQCFRNGHSIVTVPRAPEQASFPDLPKALHTIDVDGDDLIRAISILKRQHPTTLKTDKTTVEIVLAANQPEIRMSLPVAGGFAEATCPLKSFTSHERDFVFKTRLSFLEPILAQPGCISKINFHTQYLRFEGLSGGLRIITIVAGERPGS